MDRSFLTNEKVIDASRNFICIRLATYEDEYEAKFMKQIHNYRNDMLENTIFAMLAPDGKTNLTRSGRSPHFAFRNASQMASQMGKYAKQYKVTKPYSDSKINPKMKDLSVALNVAACDSLPVVVAISKSEEKLAELESTVSKIAWSEKLQGQFVTASMIYDAKKVRSIADMNQSEGIFLIGPGTFGLSAKILAEFKGSEELDQIESKMVGITAKYEPPKLAYRSHIQTGVNLGIDWKSKIPVTDRESVQAKERMRGKK